MPRQNADHHRQAEPADVVEEAVERARIVDRLGHHQLGARRLLVLEPAQLAIAVVGGGLAPVASTNEVGSHSLPAGSTPALSPAAMRKRPPSRRRYTASRNG